MSNIKEIFDVQNRIKEKIDKIIEHKQKHKIEQRDVVFEDICACFDILCLLTEKCIDSKE